MKLRQIKEDMILDVEKISIIESDVATNLTNTGLLYGFIFFIGNEKMYSPQFEEKKAAIAYFKKVFVGVDNKVDVNTMFKNEEEERKKLKKSSSFLHR